MNYKLMHKNIIVADIEIDTASSAISKVGKIYSFEHIPVGINVISNTIDRKGLNDWWKKRSIPASRDGIHSALEKLGISSTELLLEKCYGLSLSDHYWVCPVSLDLTWNEINFFQHSFSENVGNILLGHASSDDSIDLLSPDNSSAGWLRKKWTIIDGKRCLIKGGSGLVQQEPFNEVLAYNILNRLNINCVEYKVITKNDYPYSVCENFITENTELITARHLLKSKKKSNHITTYQHFIDCCEDLGIKNAVDYLNCMLTVDFLIANEDRHSDNFGLIRNAETLEYIGFAPVYDNGTSLWVNTPTNRIKPLSPKLPSKPFKDTHSEQIKLVTSFDWLDFSLLNGIENDFYAILKKSAFIDKYRRETLCNALKDRLELLKEIVEKS